MKGIGVLLVCFAVFGAGAEDLNWLTNLPAAQAQAKGEHKNVLINFTGSDWCPACILFQVEIESSPEFTAYAATNLVLMLVDFPRRKPLPFAQEKANDELLEKFNLVELDGTFPLPIFVLLNSDGKRLETWKGYKLGTKPQEFIHKLQDAAKK